MCYIELKNDKYETSEDLKHLLQYILRLDKTAEDSQRANTITNTLAGCQPAMIPNEYLCDPSAVYHLMLFEVKRRQKGTTQFAKHRIVSFAATDCVLPQDVVSLAERIASIYAKNGYITAYGIHADRFNVHIHFAVCAVSFQTQNMFHIQWEAERKMLVSVTNQWKSEFDEMLAQPPFLQQMLPHQKKHIRPTHIQLFCFPRQLLLVPYSRRSLWHPLSAYFSFFHEIQSVCQYQDFYLVRLIELDLLKTGGHSICQKQTAQTFCMPVLLPLQPTIRVLDLQLLQLAFLASDLRLLQNLAEKYTSAPSRLHLSDLQILPLS